MNDANKPAGAEIDEIDIAFNNKLQSQEARERIIDVICDSEKVDKKINSLCDKKIDGFDKDLKIEALTKITQGAKFWTPVALSALLGIGGITAVMTNKQITISIPDQIITATSTPQSSPSATNDSG